MRWIAAAALLCLSAGARAEELCGGGVVSGGRLEVRVLASKAGKAPPRVTYVHVGTSSLDGAYRLSVNYAPTDSGLGIPTMARIDIAVPVPDPQAAEPEQIAWRAGPGAWFNPGYWVTPRRTAADPKVNPEGTRGSVDYTIAQGRVHPYRTELLETFVRGVRWEFRRLDKSGKAIGSGSVDYPPPPAVAGLYQEARRKAVASLRPCSYGPPITAAPPPPPPAPAPRDPAELDADSCRYFRRQEKLAAERKPEAGQRMKIVGQPVDCGARSVKRVFEVESIRKSERREIGAALQSLSDKLWCPVPVFRTMMKRGWTFGAEIRAPGDPTVIAATTRKCPG